MTEREQMMCEIQGEFFELSNERLKCGSAYFIAKFMNSEIARELDQVENPYNFYSPNNLIISMKIFYPSLDNEKGAIYPKHLLKWIGEIYRAYALIKKESSSKIYKDVKAEMLVSLYDSFHTFSLEEAVNKIAEIVNENKEQKTDKEIFYEIMNEK